MAVCSRDNRGFLFIATLPTCRRVGWAGRRRAWGSPGCPARGGRGRVLLLRPSVRAPCTRLSDPAARLHVIPPTGAWQGEQSSRGGWKRHRAPGYAAKGAPPGPRGSSPQDPLSWGAIYRPGRKIPVTPSSSPQFPLASGGGAGVAAAILSQGGPPRGLPSTVLPGAGSRSKGRTTHPGRGGRGEWAPNGEGVPVFLLLL